MLANLIYQKHTNDGAVSPLKELKDDNWTDNGSKIANALELDAAVKKMEKDHEISEDDHERLGHDVQKATDEAISEIDKMLAVKEKEILTV